MSFLSPLPPAPRSEPENGIGSAAKASAEIERRLAERGRVPELEPVLGEIARVSAELLRHPRVAEDSEALHILRMMALAEDMERVEALAEALRSCLAKTAAPFTPAPRDAEPRSARVLLRL
ncbi:hypothetical protein [Aureimonas sp. AU4]|uniref:hypothetical protein n=1 Tax=Aureimonas sp. AU4 TaxID=1638163 RepID=UPI0007849CE9|nr:hypothetical protein [Aureimonas sp. AU4]